MIKKITPLQARILEQFYKEGVYNTWEMHPVGKSYYPMEHVLNALKIKETRERNNAAKDFYDLIRKGLIKSNKERLNNTYYMTKRGYRLIKGLERGKIEDLERDYVQKLEIRGNKTEKGTLERIAASIFIGMGLMSIILEAIGITGRAISTQGTINSYIIIGGLLLIIIGIVLMKNKRKS